MDSYGSSTGKFSDPRLLHPFLIVGDQTIRNQRIDQKNNRLWWFIELSMIIVITQKMKNDLIIILIHIHEHIDNRLGLSFP